MLQEFKKLWVDKKVLPLFYWRQKKRLGFFSSKGVSWWYANR